MSQKKKPNIKNKTNNMHSEHLTLEKHIKRANFISTTLGIIVTVLCATTIAYGFYYNTKGTLNQHTEDIKELKVNVTEVVTKVNESAVYQGVSSTEIKALQDKVNSIDSKVDKVDEKLDRLIAK